MTRRFLLALLPIIITLLAAVWLGPQVYRYLRTRSYRFGKLGEWFKNPAAHPDWTIQGGTFCDPLASSDPLASNGNAPFLLPTSGYVGFLWDDSFKFGERHQGIDTFGGTEVGVTPVVAAYSGYLTRRSDWISTVAIRIPSDPLQPDRQIWLYYTHMATADGNSLITEAFPPGSAEVFVEAGILLGYQGNYSGDVDNPTGVHLHFSIVLDDGKGFLRNELNIRNTLDPSPYLGLELNANRSGKQVPVCLPSRK